MKNLGTQLERDPSLPLHDISFAYHYASIYQERGFSVVPMLGKTPALPWMKFQKERPTLEQLSSWFGERAKQQFNLAIVTGRVSGLVVVDTDSVKGAEFWLKNRPRTPLIAKSGGGNGFHFYYQANSTTEIRNRTRVLSRSIDIRGESGLIVAPPSIHPETGRPYEWLHSFDEYCLNDIPVFDVEWIWEPSNKRPAAPSRFASNERPIRNVRAWIRKVKAISGQNGHSQTFRVACKLRDAGLSPEDALSEITEWSESGCAIPPWSRTELVHKINSAYAQHRNREDKTLLRAEK